MKKKVNYIKGFTLVEVLLVMGIFILLTVIGFNGFLSIRESFIARENVELIIQDIESTKLKAMNMEGGKDATWIYGFGIDLSQVHQLNLTGDYEFFKWCSPVPDYGSSQRIDSTDYYPTENVLPSLYNPANLNSEVNDNFYKCGTTSTDWYLDGTNPGCYMTQCEPDRVGLVKTSEISSLLDREEDQIEVLNIPVNTRFPAFLLFESLTGRAIVYDNEGYALGYEYDGSVNDVVFDNNQLVPIDIVLHRKRSEKFDLITVYPNSGEVIHHVYNKLNTGNCPSGYNILDSFQVGGVCYPRYGIDDEINSFRD